MTKAISIIKYDVYSAAGNKLREVELNPTIFGLPINAGLVHQAVRAQLNNARVAIAHTKSKGEVRGGGKKPWRQKGTGRARHGSSRSPIWVGGGITFGPRSDRNFAEKINQKMKRKAMFICLSDRVADKAMVIIDKFEVKFNKTREFVSLIKNFREILNLKEIKKHRSKEKNNLKNNNKETNQEIASVKEKKFDLKDYKVKILVIVSSEVGKISRISRNIAGVKVLGANSINVVDILKHRNILIDEASLKVIEQTYLKK